MAHFPGIDAAHKELVDAVAEITKPGASPIPITLISVNANEQGQLIVFEEPKWTKEEVARRLRLAADYLEGTQEKVE